jgi:hypothetical protein
MGTESRVDCDTLGLIYMLEEARKDGHQFKRLITWFHILALMAYNS